MPFAMNTTIQILRAVRVAFGLSQAELAVKAGVSLSSIARLELGEARGWNTFIAVQTTFEKMGVQFVARTSTNGWGVFMPADWDGREPDTKS